jgi:hypothetical protein
MTTLEQHCKDPIENDIFSQLFREHFIQTIQALAFCKYLKPPEKEQFEQKSIYLDKPAKHKRNS